MSFGRLYSMIQTHKTLTQALILTSLTTCVLLLGAHSASANDGASSTLSQSGQVFVHQKSALSEAPAVIRVHEPLPALIMPMNTDFKAAVDETEFETAVDNQQRATDLRDFDLIEDSPLFIGAKGATEYDTRDAQYDTGSFPKTLDIDPLYTVAGAGVSTSF